MNKVFLGDIISKYSNKIYLYKSKKNSIIFTKYLNIYIYKLKNKKNIK